MAATKIYENFYKCDSLEDRDLLWDEYTWCYVDDVTDNTNNGYFILENGEFLEKAPLNIQSPYSTAYNFKKVTRQKYVVVTQLSDFPTPVDNKIYLLDGFTYEISGNIDMGINQIVIGIKNTIRGLDRINDKLISNIDSDYFIIMDSSSINKASLFIENLTIDCHNGIIFNVFGGSNTHSIILNNIILNNIKSVGTFNNVSSISIRTSVFSNIIDNGFSFVGTINTLQIRDSKFINNNGITLNLDNASFNIIDMSRNNITITSPNIFMSGLINNGNIINNGLFYNNILLGNGIKLVNILETDSKWLISNNIGINNTNNSENEELKELFIPENNQTLFTLSKIPNSVALVKTYVNNVLDIESFTISGTILTYIGTEYNLSNTDLITVIYK